MTPEQQTIERINRIISENCFNAHPAMRASILSAIRDLVLAEVLRLVGSYDNNGYYIGLRPRTAAEIEAAMIKVLGGGK